MSIPQQDLAEQCIYLMTKDWDINNPQAITNHYRKELIKLFEAYERDADMRLLALEESGALETKGVFNRSPQHPELNQEHQQLHQALENLSREIELAVDTQRLPHNASILYAHINKELADYKELNSYSSPPPYLKPFKYNACQLSFIPQEHQKTKQLEESIAKAFEEHFPVMQLVDHNAYENAHSPVHFIPSEQGLEWLKALRKKYKDDPLGEAVDALNQLKLKIHQPGVLNSELADAPFLYWHSERQTLDKDTREETNWHNINLAENRAKAKYGLTDGEKKEINELAQAAITSGNLDDLHEKIDELIANRIVRATGTRHFIP